MIDLFRKREHVFLIVKLWGFAFKYVNIVKFQTMDISGAYIRNTGSEVGTHHGWDASPSHTKTIT